MDLVEAFGCHSLKRPKCLQVFAALFAMQSRRPAVMWEYDYNRRFYHGQVEPNWSDELYVAQFRVPKAMFNLIARGIAGHRLIVRRSRRRHMTSHEMLALALTYFASGSPLRLVGSANGWSKTSASRAVEQVARAIHEVFGSQYLKFPTGTAELNTIAKEFQLLAAN
jgi:hypothetical protein